MGIHESLKDLPWPEKDNSIFTHSDDWQNNACFHFSHDKMGLYADGYLYAAEALIDSVVEQAQLPNYIDAKVYPILFLYHHHIELRLKDIVSKGNSLLDEEEKFPKHHKIYDLWCLAKKIIIKINKDGNDTEDIESAGKVVKELSSINNDAEGYRYPYNKDGNLLLKDIETLNLDTLRKTMEKITTFLDAACEQIYVYLDYKSDMESSFM